MEDNGYRRIFWTIIILTIYAIQNSLQMQYEIVDNSKSKYCENGLLQSKDTVMLNITVTYSEDEDSSTFVMEAVDVHDGFTISICNISLMFDCSLKKVQGCFCLSRKDQMYYIRYHSIANIMLRNNRLKVNGELVPFVKFQDIFAARPGVTLTVTGSHVVMNKNCRIRTVVDTTLRFNLCLTGLDSPSLYISYNGVNNTEQSSCLSTTYMIIQNQSRIYISYEDKCRRKVQLWCSIHADLELEMSTRHPEREEHEYPWIYLIVGGLLLFSTSALFFVYTKLRKSLAQDTAAHKSADTLSSEAIEAMESTAVDPQLTPASKSSSTSLRRLTERLGLKSMSITSQSPLSPKKNLSRPGSTEI